MVNEILSPRVSGRIMKIATALAAFGMAFGIGAGALGAAADRPSHSVLADNTWPGA